MVPKKSSLVYCGADRTMNSVSDARVKATAPESTQVDFHTMQARAQNPIAGMVGRDNLAGELMPVAACLGRLLVLVISARFVGQHDRHDPACTCGIGVRPLL